MRELEEKRINKEMANIRKKFKGVCSCQWLVHPCNLRTITTRREFGRISKEKVCPSSFFKVTDWEFIALGYRYVAKIIFTYILGYKVDIGHMEAVNLIASHKYSEKQIVRLCHFSQNSLTDHSYRDI